MRGRLKELNAEIVVEDAWAPELQRVNNVSLMKKICELRAKTIANAVQMWLRVITAAELADADGACISPEKLDGRWRNDFTHLWPNIPWSSEKMFEIFRLYVRRSLCSNVRRHHQNERLTLDKRLATWHQVHRHSRNEWCRTAK